MNRVAHYALLLVAMLAGSGTQAQEKNKGKTEEITPATVDITGTYSYTRKLPGAKKADGTLTITKAGSLFRLTIVYENATVNRGLAIRGKDTLSVSWEGQNPISKAKGSGISQVTISLSDNKPKLDGRWAEREGGYLQAFEEEATFLARKEEKKEKKK